MRQNWRPITLLPVDYKILAKILFNRLKLVAKDLVDPDQSCSLPGRNIRHGILTIFFFFLKIKSSRENGILLSVDQKSAFDMVEWKYLFKTLDHFGVGPIFYDG